MENTKKLKKLKKRMTANKPLTFLSILFHGTYEKHTPLYQCSYYQVGHLIHIESGFGQQQGSSLGQQVVVMPHSSRVQHWS